MQVVLVIPCGRYEGSAHFRLHHNAQKAVLSKPKLSGDVNIDADEVEERQSGGGVRGAARESEKREGLGISFKRLSCNAAGD